MAKYEAHDFYCLNCGQKTLPVHRKKGQERGAFHRKRLWCVHCKAEINCVEIRNQQEKEKFLEAYENGEFREEAANSLCACRPSWGW